MKDALEYILSDFWHFVGTLFLINAVFEGLATVVQAIKTPTPPRP